MSNPATIKNIDLSRLTNAELDEASLSLIPVLNKITTEPLPPFIADFTQKTSAYSAAIKQQQISVLTEDIQNLDRNRDRALTELFHAVANELLSTDPATRAAAVASANSILTDYEHLANRRAGQRHHDGDEAETVVSETAPQPPPCAP